MPRLPLSALPHSLGLALVVALTAAIPACSHDSYLVLTLKSDGTSFAAITKVEVDVTASSGQPMAMRTFTVGGSDGGVSIDATLATAKTLSVSFTPDRSGLVNVKVSISNASGCVGTGTVPATIDKGGVARATVTLSPSGCTNQDAGATDGTTTFPGCDPAVASSCPHTQTCYVDCATKMGRCVPGGAKGPGETCVSNNDCSPGTQCFDFGCATPTRVCLKFCTQDNACATMTNATGTSTCRDPVYCPAVTTYKTCGFACDPRGNGTAGCPTGLDCFLFQDLAGGQDSPSCGCPSPSRVGVDGATCASSNDCAPGFLCDQMAGAQVCRRLCKMSSATDCTGGQSCAALTNNTVFGVCVPP